MSHEYHPHCGCSQCCDIEESEDEESLVAEMDSLMRAIGKLQANRDAAQRADRNRALNVKRNAKKVRT